MALSLLLMRLPQPRRVALTSGRKGRQQTQEASAPAGRARMQPRVPAAVTAAIVIFGLSSIDVSALSCVELPDEVTAAQEAINGKHPAWAMGYTVAVVESISRPRDSLSLTIRPTHVFSGEYPERLTVRARPDGPPDPRLFRLGSSYFLSLGRVGPSSRDLLIQPCAPNFEVTAEQVEQLVDVAPHVEIRQFAVTSADPPGAGWPLVAGLAVAAALLLGITIIIRGHRPRTHA